MVNISRIVLTVMFAVSLALPIQSNAQGTGAGAVFVMTNAADQNEIISYVRNADGSLGRSRHFSTGGRGSGGTIDPLASQGSLTLTEDHSFLLAVNAGSGEISVFRVRQATLALVDVIACGGSEPVAVAQRGNLVYVLNAGGTSNVVGFYLDRNGKLSQIRNSTAFLTTANSGAASLSFSPDGHTLLVTEKATNRIDAFQVHADGTLGPIVVNPAIGPGTFAVLFAPNGAALVAETGPTGGHNASAISSYELLPNGSLSAVSASVPTLGAATCWLAVTPNGRFVYTSNSASATISGFAISANGSLESLAGTVLATLPTGSANLDLAITTDGKFLYSLDSGTGTVSIFGIGEDGLLTSLGELGSFRASAGANGIAAN
ncbi:MAG TPA: beta-propeller fold lactonase family protein [Terriglobales bacterium]|nr:beta-propeller fold lactonase family protein [Terriglobales bacterium]